MNDFINRIEAIASEVTRREFASIIITGDVNDADYVSRVTEYDLTDKLTKEKFKTILKHFETYESQWFEKDFLDDCEDDVITEIFDSVEIPSDPGFGDSARIITEIIIFIWDENGNCKNYTLKN